MLKFKTKNTFDTYKTENIEEYFQMYSKGWADAAKSIDLKALSEAFEKVKETIIKNRWIYVAGNGGFLDALKCLRYLWRLTFSLGRRR